MEELTFDSVIDTGSRSIKGKTVREIFDKDSHLIFEMIKKYHFSFSDDVLEAAHITKTISNRRIYQEEIHIPRDKDLAQDNKKLKKDTKDIETILDEITGQTFEPEKKSSQKKDSEDPEDDSQLYNNQLPEESEE